MKTLVFYYLFKKQSVSEWFQKKGQHVGLLNHLMVFCYSK